MLQALIAGMGLTLVLRQSNYLNAGILGGIPAEQMQGAISGAVVDTYNLNISQRLTQQRVKTLRQESLRIIDCDKNTNLRHDGRIWL